ncbi:hypothetical protein R3P38DRAFT_2838014 [Favolaschia claudopus]|uniref:Uncharacterized protein n=1 Tax=Favolaschia claudopus TaxID=2862362 RepID=A0AAV9ZMG5_9AGAR
MTTMATGGLPPAEIVSCTVVALPDGSSHFDLESHDFLNLFVTGQAIALYPEDSDSSSIQLSSLVGSILFQVQNLSNPHSELPILLYNILSNPHLRPHMQIATTSIPIFDSRKKNPGYGYRSLGSFHQFLPPYSTERRIDSVALDRAWGEMPEIFTYKRCLRAVGLRSFAKHFILILSNLHEQRSPIFDLSFLPSLPPALPDEASTSNSALQSFVTEAPIDQNVGYSLDNAYPSSELYFPLPGSSPSAATVSDLPDLSSPPTLPSCLPAQPLLANFLLSPEITEYVGVAFILQRAGFTDDEITQGRHQELGTLWGMIRNHHHACEIVSWFGLSVVKQDSCVKFNGGRKLTTADVVIELGWNPSTFAKKSKAYRKAKVLARTHSWRNSPPAFASSPTAHTTYVFWQAVRSMFGPTGFCDQPFPPRNDALGSNDERRVSTLSQNELYSKLTQLVAYLSQ